MPNVHLVRLSEGMVAQGVVLKDSTAAGATYADVF